jgi:hypothetical protein
MASTYSQNLKIELMGTGDQVDAWGGTTNENLGTTLEEAIVGYGAVQFTNDANLTLTLSNSNETQTARKFFFYVTSTVSLSTQRDLIVPTIEKTYTVHNNTTGSQAIRVKTSAGTGIVVPSGKKMVLYVNGTNVIEQLDYATSLTVGTLAVSTPLPIASGGTGASDASGARASLGLGSIAIQNASSVAITGGSITGITDLAVADGGTGASTAADARTNLGLGTIATQSASSVAITGGSITGITDLAVADGGTGASDASGARTNLGLGTIATQDASAVAITGGSITGITDLAVADGGTGSSTASGARTNLGAAASGANSDITALSGLTTPLSVTQGGTGQSSYTNGQLLIGNTTGNTLTKATLTAGTGVTITNGSGAITVAAPYSLGEGQTWQNVIGSRTTGVAYSNTTGRTIFVVISAYASVASTSKDSTFLVDGVIVAYHLSQNNAGTDAQPHNYFMPIPAGSTYQLNTAGAGGFALSYWFELR